MVDRRPRCPLVDRPGGSRRQRGRFRAPQSRTQSRPTSPPQTERIGQAALTCAYHARAVADRTRGKGERRGATSNEAVDAKRRTNGPPVPCGGRVYKDERRFQPSFWQFG